MSHLSSDKQICIRLKPKKILPILQLTPIFFPLPLQDRFLLITLLQTFISHAHGKHSLLMVDGMCDTLRIFQYA